MADESIKKILNELYKAIQEKSAKDATPKEGGKSDDSGGLPFEDKTDPKKQAVFKAQQLNAQIELNSAMLDTIALGEALESQMHHKAVLQKQYEEAVSTGNVALQTQIQEELNLIDASQAKHKSFMESFDKMTIGQRQARKTADDFWLGTLKYVGLGTKAQNTYTGKFLKFLKAFEGAGKPSQFFKSLGAAIFNLPLAILDSMINETIGMIKNMDAAASTFSKATGFGKKYNDTIYNSSMAMADLGATAEEVNKSLTAVTENFSNFGSISEDVATRLSNAVTALGQIGVGGKEAAITMDFFRTIGGQTEEQAIEMTNAFAMMGKASGLGAGKMVREFAAASPKLAVYGTKAKQIFADIAAASAASGASVSSLLDLAGKFDTFAGAAETAGKLNAILGSNLSANELLLMTEEQRIETVIQQIQMGGRAFSDMDRFTQKAIAQAAGINDMTVANKVFNMSFGEYKKHQDKMAAQKKTQDEVNKTAMEAKNITDKFRIAMNQLIMKEGPALLKWFHSIIDPTVAFIKENKEMIKYVVLGRLAFAVFGPVVKMAAFALKGFNFVIKLGLALTKGLGNGIAWLSKQLGWKTAKTVVDTGVEQTSNVVKGESVIMNRAVGTSAMFSSKGLLAMGGAILMVGAGIYIAATGLSNFVNAFKGLSPEQLSAVNGALIGFAVGLGVLVGVLLVVAYAGAAAVPPMLGIGAAVLMMGLGIGIAAAGIGFMAQGIAALAQTGAAGVAVVLGLAASIYFLQPALLSFAASAFAATPSAAALTVALSGLALPLIGIGFAALMAGTGLYMAGQGVMFIFEAFSKMTPGVIQGAAAMLMLGGAIFLVAAAVSLMANPLAQVGLWGTVALITAIGASAFGMAAYINSQAEYVKSLKAVFADIGNIKMKNTAEAIDDIAEAMAKVDANLGAGEKRVQVVSSLASMAQISTKGVSDAAAARGSARASSQTINTNVKLDPKFELLIKIEDNVMKATVIDWVETHQQKN